MTLNITKKKIEKVLELFNHPQTRKIRINRGKKRRRNNKSFNRKNGRKNLATSTLKKKGGHAGHPIFLNGGQVGVVLGGQVGGEDNEIKTLKSISDDIKKKIKETIDTFTPNVQKLNFVKYIVSLYKNKNYQLTDDEYQTKLNDYNNINNNNDNNNNKDNEENLNESDIKLLEYINGEMVSIETKEDDPEEKIEENTKEIDESKTEVVDTSPNNEEQDQSTPEETKKVETKESKEIDTSEMLKVALASNYFTQYGILSGMLKMNQDKNKDKFNVMDFVQDPKLYAEFCNKMGFQFAEMKEKVNEEPVVDNKAKEENQDANSDADENKN